MIKGIWYCLRISIHAPLRGATNSRYCLPSSDDISIHAPLRGATPRLCGCQCRYQYFYPRTPAGCDSLPCRLLISSIVFLSTHPCGVRPSKSHIIAVTRLISIHAPLRGATEAATQGGGADRFLSTHPCGVRLSWHLRPASSSKFLSTHPCGVRPVS